MGSTYVTVDRDMVASVYSGRKDACACGCAGSHRYATQWQRWSSEARGYAVADDELNDRQVARVLNKISAIANDEQDGVYHGEEGGWLSRFIWAEQGNRMYVAYLASGKGMSA